MLCYNICLTINFIQISLTHARLLLRWLWFLRCRVADLKNIIKKNFDARACITMFYLITNCCRIYLIFFKFNILGCFIDAGHDAASYTWNNLAASNTCIQFGYIYACNNLFYTIIAGTGSILDAGNDAESKTCNNLSASNTYIQFGCRNTCLPLLLYYYNWMHWKHLGCMHWCCIHCLPTSYLHPILA